MCSKFVLTGSAPLRAYRRAGVHRRRGVDQHHVQHRPHVIDDRLHVVQAAHPVRLARLGHQVGDHDLERARLLSASATPSTRRLGITLE